MTLRVLVTVVVALGAGAQPADAKRSLDPKTRAIVEAIASDDLAEIADAFNAHDLPGYKAACKTLVRHARVALDADRRNGYPRAAWTHLQNAMEVFVKDDKLCVRSVEGSGNRELDQLGGEALKKAIKELNLAGLSNQ